MRSSPPTLPGVRRVELGVSIVIFLSAWDGSPCQKSLGSAVCVLPPWPKWPHRHTAPRLHTALIHIPGPNLPGSVSTQPHRCPAPHWTFLALRSSLPCLSTPPSPAPRAHTVMAAEWVSLHGSLETGPPFLLVPAVPGAWVPLPTSKHVVSWGSRGRGSRWLPRWLVAFPPLSLSLLLSPSLGLPCSLRCYRSHR